MSDDFPGFGFTIFGIAVAAVFLVAYCAESSDCAAKGGIYVQGLVGFECVESKR